MPAPWPLAVAGFSLLIDVIYLNLQTCATQEPLGFMRGPNLFIFYSFRDLSAHTDKRTCLSNKYVFYIRYT